MSDPGPPVVHPAPPARSLRSLVAAFGALMLLLLALSLLALSGFRELARANRWSIHTYRVLAATEGMRGAMAEMETAFRGFALSGEPRYRDAWSAGARDFEGHADSARRLLADNPRQQVRLAAVRRLQAGWRAAQAGRMPSAGSDSLAVAAARARAAEPESFRSRRITSDSVRAILAVMERSEFELLRARADRARALERRTGWLVAAGVFLALLVAGGAGALALRRTAGLRRANLLLTTEAAERILARRAAERLARQNELLLNAAAEGIYGVDAHGYTTFVNPAAAAMLGYGPDDLPGRPYEATLLSSSDGDPIRAALLSGVPQTVRDATFRRADGERFPVEFTCTPIVEEGHMAGAVITFRDVTERREVDRMKDEFVSVVSHELRTPLTAIRGSLGLLAAGKAGEVPERGQRMLDIAVQNTDRLIRLINDILDLERIESGKVAMEQRPVNAAELAHNAAEVMLPMAERAGVGLFVEAEAVRLLADADRILQVLTNLISNAMKFSPPGGSVEVRVEPVDGEARFRVADQGRGIPADRLESIFERFQQVDSSDSRQKGGTGLGLAICRTIVTQHGGRIWAESEPGAGSTFHFTIPLAPEDASAAAPDRHRFDASAAPAVDVEPAGGKDGVRRVLVVEDDEDLARVLAETFERRGVAAEVVGTGERAWTAARRRRPDAVVLDIALPDGDGYWLAERFREHEGLRGVPIVAYTALDPDEPGRDRLRRTGVDVLTKSRIEPAELERRVMALLDGAGTVPGPPALDPDLPSS